MNKNLFVALFALVLPILGVGAAAADEIHTAAFGRDFSNRCSLAEKRVIAGWNDGDCDGFSTNDPVDRFSIVEGVEGWSNLPYEGRSSLRIDFPPGRSADSWRTIGKTFDRPLDLSATPLIEYGIWSAEGPGRDFITRLTLLTDDGERFEAMAHIIPTLWRSVIFNVADCGFLDRVARIEISLKNDSRLPWQSSYWLVDGLSAGKPLDFDFNLPGASERFSAEGDGKIGQRDGALTFDFHDGSALKVETHASHNNIYNPPVQLRNTVALALRNESSARALRLYFSTDSLPRFSAANSKLVELEPGDGNQLVSFNLSDLPGAVGRLRGLKLELEGGNGRLVIDRISFERETPITPNCGRITGCKAFGGYMMSVEGEINPGFDFLGATIEIRHCPLWKSELPFDSLETVAAAPAARHFLIDGIPNARHISESVTLSHLSSRFQAALRLPSGETVALGEPFFIENWRDFTENPYQFDIAETAFYPEGFGAKADGITNDNEAIQRAIDAASASGGGRVVLRGNSSSDRSREFLATNLLMREGVELVIEPGAVLRQSPVFSHYVSYRPEYGHDNIIPGVPWTHCMYTNMPLILAKDTEQIKITGGGTIRMDDTYSENPAWTHYARNCSDRLHIVPIAVCNTSHVEISDIDIKRCSNYHTIFYRADSVFIGNLKMLEVACLSGDGLSFGNAVTNVRVARAVFESNDDGIVLCSSYKDPRGGNWRERVDSIDSSVRHIEVMHSYIDCARGGGGKAIALIPWGSTNPRQDYNEINDIEVTDCVLRGGNSVGSWPDNPFDGKPFDNMEQDDYAPVKNLRIFGNEYLSPCALNGVVPTTLLTDCGLHGSTTFKNADFADRLAYWTPRGDVSAEPGKAAVGNGIIYQGLYLTPGTYRIAWEGEGDFVSPVAECVNGTALEVNENNEFTVGDDDTYIIGLMCENATISSVGLIRQ